MPRLLPDSPTSARRPVPGQSFQALASGSKTLASSGLKCLALTHAVRPTAPKKVFRASSLSSKDPYCALSAALKRAKASLSCLLSACLRATFGSRRERAETRYAALERGPRH